MFKSFAVNVASTIVGGIILWFVISRLNRVV